MRCSIGKLALLFLLLALASCEVKMPDYVMSSRKMEKVLYDYHLVQSMSNQYTSYDFTEKLYYDYVFKKHKITKERFDSSMQWYSRHPKYLKRIYENIVEDLEYEVEMLDNEKAVIQNLVLLDVSDLAKDSAELWGGTKVRMLSSTPLNSRLAFSFDTPEDTTFVAGDSLSFSFTAFFIPSSADSLNQKAYSSLRLEYSDSTVFTNAVVVGTSGKYSLSSPRYMPSRLKSISGFVYYSDNDTTSASCMLLGDLSVVRIHPVIVEDELKERQ